MKYLTKVFENLSASKSGWSMFLHSCGPLLKIIEREKTLFRQFVTSNQNKHTIQDQINGKRLHNTYKKNQRGDCEVTKNNWSSCQAATR